MDLGKIIANFWKNSDRKSSDKATAALKMLGLRSTGLGRAEFLALLAKLIGSISQISETLELAAHACMGI